MFVLGRMVCQRGTVLRYSLQAILLIIFIVFFGQQAVVRYMEKKTYVLSDIRPSSGIQTPSLTICPQNKVTGNAWKNVTKIQALNRQLNQQINSFANISILCHGNYTKCIEEETYSLSDVVVEFRRGSNKDKDPSKTKSKDIKSESSWQESLSHYGRCFTFDSDDISGTDYSKDELLFYLNATIDYTIYIHDPNFVDLKLLNPLSVPSVHIELKSEQSKGILYTIALTEVTELSVPQDPCNKDPGYNFQVTRHLLLFICNLFLPLAPANISRCASGTASPLKLSVN